MCVAYQIHFCTNRQYKDKFNRYRAFEAFVPLHDAESLPTTLADHRRLDVFDMRFQRRLLCVFWQQHISDQSVQQHFILRQRRLRWVGHFRMPSFLPDLGPTASTQASIVGKDQQEAQPLNNNITGGSTQSSPTSGLLALTPPKLSRWFLGPDCSLCKAFINRLPSFTSELDSSVLCETLWKCC